MRNFGFAIALAAGSLAVTPAFAGDSKLTWSDLDLTTDAGKTELDHRIDLAAQQICTPRTVTGTIITGRASASCVADARGKIAAQVAAKTGGQYAGRSASNALAEARH